MLNVKLWKCGNVKLWKYGNVACVTNAQYQLGIGNMDIGNMAAGHRLS